MKNSKKLLSVLLTFIMTFGMVFGGLTTAFAAGATDLPTSSAATDGYFNASELTAGVTIVAPLGTSGAAMGDTIQLLVGGIPVTVLDYLLATANINAGAYSFTVNAVHLGSDGPKIITTRIVDAASNVGSESPPLNVTMDTIIPTALSNAANSSSFKVVSATSITVVFSENLDASKFVTSNVNGFAVSGGTATLTDAQLGADGVTVTLIGTNFVAGTTTVAYTAGTLTDLAGNALADITATVTPVVAVTGVALDQPTLALTAGGATGTLVATTTPANATDQSVTWASDTVGVATVDNAGVVTGVSAGTAIITVTTTDGGFIATSTVTVTAPVVAVTGVALDQPTLALTAGGATGTLVATTTPANATDQSVTWASDTVGVATVDNAGVVTGVSAGTAIITVTTTDGGFIATSTVTVTAPDTTAPTLSATSASSVAATTATLNFTSDEAGTYYYLVYAAADPTPNAATIKVQGVAVAKGTAAASAAANTANVTGMTASTGYNAYVIVEDASLNASAVSTITVNTTAAPAVTSVTVTPATATVVQGGTQQLTVTVVVVGGAAQTVDWNSSDVNGKVLVTLGGMVTVDPTAAVGTYTITATSTVDGSKTDTSVITVTAPAVKTTLTAAINAEYADGAARTTDVLIQADYTATSWTAYVNAITAAIAVEGNAFATQTEVDNAEAAIATTKTALEFAGQVALDTALAAEALLVAADYVSYANVTTALALPETTNAEVVIKTTAINDAIAGLVLKTNLAAYNAALAAVAQVDYTVASWDAYQLVVTANVVTVANTQAEVDAATAAITTAQGSLVAVPVAVTPVAPSVTNDDTANTVTGMAVGMEYNLDAAGYVVYDATAFGLLDFSGDHTLLVRVAAEGINPFGPDTTLTFTTLLGEDKKVTSIAGNNILLVGDYAFDLSDSANNHYDLNNFLKASQTAYFNAGTYHVYFKIGGTWYDIISDPTAPITDLTTINGNGGLFNYMNMQ